jgi:hypothetical protein
MAALMLLKAGSNLAAAHERGPDLARKHDHGNLAGKETAVAKRKRAATTVEINEIETGVKLPKHLEKHLLDSAPAGKIGATEKDEEPELLREPGAIPLIVLEALNVDENDLEDRMEQQAPKQKARKVEFQPAAQDRVPFADYLTGTRTQPREGPKGLLAAIAEYRKSNPITAVHDRVKKASEESWGKVECQADIDRIKRQFTKLAVGLWWNSRAQKTWDAQESALRTYQFFCTTFQYLAFPMDEATLIAYSMWNAPRVSLATIKKYVGHIRSRQAEMLDMPKPPTNNDMPVLERIWAGLDRAQASVKAGEIRLPMMPALINKMGKQKRENLKSQGLDPKTMDIYTMDNPIMSEAVYALMFVGALRKSEAMVKKTSSGVISEAPMLSQWVTHDDKFKMDAKTPTFAEGGYSVLALTGRKNDQKGVRSSVVLGQTGDNLVCAHRLVNLMLAERVRRGEKLTGETPLFLVRDGKGKLVPLYFDAFDKALTNDAEKAGFDRKRYKGHSFRIGAATAMAINGVPRYWIENLGGWAAGSKSVDIYTRLNLQPEEERAKMSAFLVGSPKQRRF